MKRSRRSGRSIGSKKGNMILESLTLILLLIIGAIVYFTADNIQFELNEEIQNDTDLHNISKEFSQKQTDVNNNIWDGAILTLLVIVWLIAMLSAWFSSEHPAFLVVSIILMLAVIVVAIFLGAAGQEWIEDPSMTTQYSRFPITVFIFDNFIPIVLGMALSVGLVLFLRWKE